MRPQILVRLIPLGIMGAIAVLPQPCIGQPNAVTGHAPVDRDLGLPTAISLAPAGPAGHAYVPVPQIIQIGCDTLSVGPLQVRIAFGILNLDPDRGFCEFFFDPVIDDRTNGPPIAACSTAVAKWAAWLSPTTGKAWWTASTDPPDCLRPGEQRAPYFFVTDSATPCYFARFINVVEWYGDQVVCFKCSQEVPTAPSTWGRIKASYR
jgi:hypothetical protein